MSNMAGAHTAAMKMPTATPITVMIVSNSQMSERVMGGDFPRS
jgi:hypothetical protein